MLKRLLLLVAVIACFCAGVWLIVDYPMGEETKDTGSKPARNGTALRMDAGSVPESSAQTTEESLDQSLKAISLTQGEGGFEIWRLKAEWANVLQQGERIIVEQPRLTYFSKERDGPPLYVDSDKGDIEQKKQILRFVHNVNIRQEDKQMKGSLLIYNGTAKTMTFPDGAVFYGTGMQGRAEHIVWDIDNKIISGTGEVSLMFEKKASAPSTATKKPTSDI